MSEAQQVLVILEISRFFSSKTSVSVKPVLEAGDVPFVSPTEGKNFVASLEEFI